MISLVLINKKSDIKWVYISILKLKYQNYINFRGFKGKIDEYSLSLSDASTIGVEIALSLSRIKTFLITISLKKITE